MNGPYSIFNFFILLFTTLFIASKLLLYIPEVKTLLNYQRNISCASIAIIIAAFWKRLQLRNNYGIQLHDADLEHSLTKERKNICLYIPLPFFLFLYSRFSFRNLFVMFSWCITISSLTICSWHGMTFSQFVQ